jgi:hypothetical protein
MILPLQKNQNNSAKCLILLGSWGQKPGKTGFGVELGGSRGVCCVLTLIAHRQKITDGSATARAIAITA